MKYFTSLPNVDHKFRVYGIGHALRLQWKISPKKKKKNKKKTSAMEKNYNLKVFFLSSSDYVEEGNMFLSCEFFNHF